VFQVYQDLLYHLLETSRLWKEGDAETALILREHVTQAVAKVHEVAAITHQGADFAKCHDLLHIPLDLFACGSSRDSSTGTGHQVY